MNVMRNRKIIAWFILIFSITNLVTMLLFVEPKQESLLYYVGFVSSGMLVILAILSLIYSYFRQDK